MKCIKHANHFAPRSPNGRKVICVCWGVGVRKPFSGTGKRGRLKGQNVWAGHRRIKQF